LQEQLAFLRDQMEELRKECEEKDLIIMKINEEKREYAERFD
jgi:hypothetical protein